MSARVALALEAAEAAAAGYARGSRAVATWRAYESDWQIFAAWCHTVDQPALPASPHTMALFLAAQAQLGHSPNILNRRRAAIRLMHVGAKVASPHDALEVDEVLRVPTASGKGRSAPGRVHPRRPVPTGALYTLHSPPQTAHLQRRGHRRRSLEYTAPAPEVTGPVWRSHG
jgi:hypothetical protein